MDYFDILLAKKLEGGGGGDVTIEQLDVTENGTYSEPGKAYRPVIVNLPLDEKIITANGTYNASDDNLQGFNKVVVNVAGYKLKAMTPGAIASFNDGQALPLTKLLIDIEPVQSGSGDPSPSNVRPITGWTECNLKNFVINLWNEEWESGYYDASGNPQPNANAIRSKNFIQVMPNMVIRPINGTDNNGRFNFYDKDKNWIGTTTGYNYNITIPSNCYYMLISTGTAYGNTYKNDISINYPSTDTSYHAYKGNTYNIEFPSQAGTVYGGSLDVTNGVLTVTDGYIASYNGETLPSTWISSMDVYAEGTTPTTGAEVVYKLATPQTYNLTPTEVKTLLGINNIFADTGDILEGEYFAAL
jgi:hypothetical protein